ncbi:MAG: galactitol-1-phosphate 5-dehydrogenase [Deltaproteobacteria bacterium]|jgi:L-iditol 2-dehydrogenase|nr:galactitol-1-phosphate 5-dehydrogenase [Deltaproteobacteria bacterium]
MKALVLHGEENLRYEDIDTPELKDGEVLIRVKASGICGSDVPRVNGNAAHYYPIVLGHEFSGVIEKIEGGLNNFKVGDKATAAPLVPCMSCQDCLKGNYALCKNYTFIGSRINGSFADYVKVPHRNVVALDESISFENGALFEPSTVALHGIYTARFRGGEDVAVLGFGTIGYFTLQWAKLLGAKRVTVFDISEERLDLAAKLGADKLINTLKSEFVKEALDYTKGNGYGYVFETAGQNSTMSLAFELAANKATVCFVGTSARDLSFSWRLFEKMNRKEFKLTGSWMSYSAPFPGKEWTMTNEYLASGKLVIDDSLIFKSFHLSEGAQAFKLFKEPRAVKGKVLLVNP